MQIVTGVCLDVLGTGADFREMLPSDHVPHPYSAPAAGSARSGLVGYRLPGQPGLELLTSPDYDGCGVLVRRVSVVKLIDAILGSALATPAFECLHGPKPVPGEYWLAAFLGEAHGRIVTVSTLFEPATDAEPAFVMLLAMGAPR